MHITSASYARVLVKNNIMISWVVAVFGQNLKYCYVQCYTEFYVLWVILSNYHIKFYLNVFKSELQLCLCSVMSSRCSIQNELD